MIVVKSDRNALKTVAENVFEILNRNGNLDLRTIETPDTNKKRIADTLVDNGYAYRFGSMLVLRMPIPEYEEDLTDNIRMYMHDHDTFIKENYSKCVSLMDFEQLLQYYYRVGRDIIGKAGFINFTNISTSRFAVRIMPYLKKRDIIKITDNKYLFEDYPCLKDRTLSSDTLYIEYVKSRNKPEDLLDEESKSEIESKKNYAIRFASEFSWATKDEKAMLAKVMFEASICI